MAFALKQLLRRCRWHRDHRKTNIETGPLDGADQYDLGVLGHSK